MLQVQLNLSSPPRSPLVLQHLKCICTLTFEYTKAWLLQVKADRGSKNMKEVVDASRGVTNATGQVVASAKTGAQMIEEIGQCHCVLEIKL